jgi:hypothetical protein
MIAPKGIIVCENADPVTTWFDWALLDFGRCIDFFLAETLGGQGSGVIAWLVPAFSTTMA